jgi:hypothetical protein
VSLIAFTVDDVYVLDFDHPEANGFGILAFKVEDIKSANGRFLYDKVKLILANGITDLANIPRIAGTIVLGGQAFHLAMPSIHEFMKQQYEALFKLDQVRCAKTEEQFKLYINRISNDQRRSTHTTCLFVLPNGYAFADDLDTANASPSIMDRRMHIVMREMRSKKALEPGGPLIPEMFYPGLFELRVLSCNAASKEFKSKSKVESFASYFTGMTVTEDPVKGEQDDL